MREQVHARTLVVVEPLEDAGRAFVEATAERGVRTTWCRDGAEALLALGAANPAGLLLAAATGVIPVHTVVELVRARWAYPVLIGVGGRDDARARRALASGASGVVTRPYDVDEVLARLDDDHDSDDDGAGRRTLLVAGPLAVDLERHEVRVSGREVRLTERELALLVHLVRRGGEVSSQDEISRAVWGGPSTTNTVAVHVNRLRSKLGDLPGHGPLIRTVRGVGYRLAPSLCAPVAPWPPAPVPHGTLRTATPSAAG